MLASANLRRGEEVWRKEIGRATHKQTYMTSSLLSLPMASVSVPPIISAYPISPSAVCLDEVILVCVSFWEDLNEVTHFW